MLTVPWIALSRDFTSNRSGVNSLSVGIPTEVHCALYDDGRPSSYTEFEMLRLYKGTDAVNVAISQLFAAVDAIRETGEEGRFLALCDARGDQVSVPPNLVNIVKLFLDSSANASGEEARKIVACDADVHSKGLSPGGEDGPEE